MRMRKQRDRGLEVCWYPIWARPWARGSWLIQLLWLLEVRAKKSQQNQFICQTQETRWNLEPLNAWFLNRRLNEWMITSASWETWRSSIFVGKDEAKNLSRDLHAACFCSPYWLFSCVHWSQLVSAPPTWNKSIQQIYKWELEKRFASLYLSTEQLSYESVHELIVQRTEASNLELKTRPSLIAPLWQVHSSTAALYDSFCWALWHIRVQEELKQALL